MNSGDQAIRVINAVTQLLGVLVWPAILLFFMVWFRRSLGDFLSNLGEFRFKAPGLEAEAKRSQVAAATHSSAPEPDRSEFKPKPRRFGDPWWA